jgi:predicted phage tail protein
MFNTHFLFASLIWGSIGFGYFIYGKKQSSWLPMIGGALMIAASYFVGSAWLMTLICAGLIAAVYVLLKRGY